MSVCTEEYIGGETPPDLWNSDSGVCRTDRAHSQDAQIPEHIHKNVHAEKRKTNPKAQQSMHVVRYGAEHEPVPE